MIVELIGSAGSGKSTLAASMSEAMPGVRVEYPPSFRRVKDIPFFINHSLKLLSSISRVLRDSDCQIQRREQLVFLIILNGWHESLRKKKENNAGVYILDQGPIYMLTILRLYGSTSMGRACMRSWLERTIEKWAEVLDALVWLDAPLPILIERVRSRNVWHGVKEMDDAAASRYLSNYYEAYAEIVDLLIARRKSLRIIRLNTSVIKVQEAVEYLQNKLFPHGVGLFVKENRSPTADSMDVLQE